MQGKCVSCSSPGQTPTNAQRVEVAPQPQSCTCKPSVTLHKVQSTNPRIATGRCWVENGNVLVEVEGRRVFCKERPNGVRRSRRALALLTTRLLPFFCRERTETEPFCSRIVHTHANTHAHHKPRVSKVAHLSLSVHVPQVAFALHVCA